ncbi:FecR domain-containing protein [Paenibacillus chibensis]|uniref:FecR domain-containing protein n=1 Tax=Paenibacillus chibensis TaxID=59846 RepID=UPI000FDB4369|nr:FecR domain-containing protein [Paenibacillus chibensis]MEC0368437.1 FecR domain-containing protein [Paenibacillus chibensis]
MKTNGLTVKITRSAAALLLGLSAYGGAASASDAGSRSMIISELKGTAYISHGGARQIRAYKGMELRAGDRIMSGSGGITLSIPDEGDEITLAANSELAILVLTEQGGHSATKLQLLRGGAYAEVHDLSKSQDAFELSPPDQKLDIKGTQFSVQINPLTGQSTVLVAGGVVQATPQLNQAGGSGSAFVYPGQQITLSPGSLPQPQVSSTDPASIVSTLSPDIIAAIIKNKADIDEENDRFIQDLLGQTAGGTGNGSDFAGDLKDREDLAKLLQSFNGFIENLAKQAGEQSKLTQAELQKIIDEANRTIADPAKRIDLNNIPAFVLPKDQTDEARKQQELVKLKQQEEELKKRQQEELNKKLQDQRDKLIEQQKKQEEANKKALEEALQKAREQFGQGMTDAERKQFELAQEQRKRDEALMDSPKPASTPQLPVSQGSSSGGGSSTTNPPVNPPAGGPEFKLDFSQDPTGERRARENHVLEFKVQPDKLSPDTPVRVKVTYTPDKEVSFDGISYYYMYKDHLSMGNFSNRSVILDAGNDTPFTLGELAENPISLRTIWEEPATYTIKIELIQAGDTAKSLGSYTSSFHVVSDDPIIHGTAGQENLEQTLTPPEGADPAKLGLELRLQKSSDHKEVPGQHFQLLYHGQLIGNSETNDEGIVRLMQPAEEGDPTEEGFKLAWLQPVFGEYILTGQWFTLSEDGENERTYIGSPFHYRYSIAAAEGTP